MQKITNPYCIVNLFYWEVSGTQLDCRKCPLDCPCKTVEIVKEKNHEKH